MKQNLLHKNSFWKFYKVRGWKGRFQLMPILVLLGMYFDAVVVFVTSQTLFFRLAWSYCGQCTWNKIIFLLSDCVMRGPAPYEEKVSRRHKINLFLLICTYFEWDLFFFFFQFAVLSTVPWTTKWKEGSPTLFPHYCLVSYWVNKNR